VEDPNTEQPMDPDRVAETRADKLVGQVIAKRYRIDELLAMGGMGAVFRGHHLLLKKRVAIKILHPETENLPELVARFEREAIAGAHVAHPNVAAATDFGQLDDGSYFLVLEYVSGRTLHHVIKKGPLAPARAIHVAKQIASALEAVHGMGILHRDVKPRNVMLVGGQLDVAKLIDFGLAKVPVEKVVALQSVRPPASSSPESARPRRRQDSILDSKPRLTGVGVIMGTIAYLAPEAAMGMEAVDARADLYALGLVLYEMLAGQQPFDGGTDAELFAQQRFRPPPPIAERSPGAEVPPALEAVVMRLLEKDPAARYQTAAETIAALEAAGAADEIGNAPTDAPPPSAPAPPASTEVVMESDEAPQPARAPAPRARPYLPVVVALAAAALGVAAVFGFRASQGMPGPAASSRPTPVETVVATAPRPPETPPVSTAPATAPASAEPVAPSATASAAPPPRDPADLANRRALLLRALRVRDWNGAEAGFLELCARDPGIFHNADMALVARDLAGALDREGTGDRVFDALENRLGTDGLDILYDLVATKGRSGAAVRAGTILRKRPVLDRASPALAVAFALREAPCADKLGLLDRAVREGDGRALVVLQTQGVACFKKNNKAVLEAMSALRARLNRGQ
jgi:serine/threonine-protein kinase